MYKTILTNIETSRLQHMMNLLNEIRDRQNSELQWCISKSIARGALLRAKGGSFLYASL